MEEELSLVMRCALFLIKNLCIDTNAETAKMEQEVTFEGKKIGRYLITVEKLKDN